METKEPKKSTENEEPNVKEKLKQKYLNAKKWVVEHKKEIATGGIVTFGMIYYVYSKYKYKNVKDELTLEKAKNDELSLELFNSVWGETGNRYCPTCKVKMNHDEEKGIWICNECGRWAAEDEVEEDGFLYFPTEESCNYYDDDDEYLDDGYYEIYGLEEDDEYGEGQESYCDVCEHNDEYPSCILRCPYDD